MKRSEQDIIGDKGVLQFQNTIPKTWIYRDQPKKDIGIDGELEIIKDMASTGDIIKVQIKGTESPQYINENKVINTELDTANAYYYCFELKIPMVIIVSDLKNNKTYWHFPQLDTDLKKNVQTAKKSGQQKITVHLPVENSLPDVLDNFDKSRYSCAIVLNTENIIHTQPPEFMDVIRGKIDFNKVIEDFQAKVDILKIDEIDTLIRCNNLINAQEKIDSLINNAQSSIQTKFAAYLSMEKISDSRAKQRLITHDDNIKARIAVAYKLKTLTQKGPMELKYFAALLYKTAELNKMAKIDHALYMTWQTHQQNAGSYIPGFYLQRQRNAEALRKKYIHCLRLIRKAFEAGHYYILPECSYRIIEAMVHFYRRLRLENLFEVAQIYNEQLRGIISSNSELAVNLKQWDSVFAFSLCYLWLADPDSPEEIQKAEKEAFMLIDFIEPKEFRDYFTDRLKEISDSFFQPLGDITPAQAIELDIQIYSGMAEAMGINLNDPTDPNAQVVLMGLADYNPERVLKNCEYLFVTLGSVGMIGQILMLPTAGMKILHCTLHHYNAGSMSLDTLYSAFAVKYCKNCTDGKARISDWHWTHEWQQEEDEKHKDLFKQKII